MTICDIFLILHINYIHKFYITCIYFSNESVCILEIYLFLASDEMASAGVGGGRGGATWPAWPQVRGSGRFIVKQILYNLLPEEQSTILIILVVIPQTTVVGVPDGMVYDMALIPLVLTWGK